MFDQLNLPKDLLSARAGKGLLRSALSREPSDLSKPITSGTGVETIDCSEKSVTFK
jgi:hypothetical protein